MATYYVSTTGSNSNLGTILSPWLTLQHAFNNVVAGDTINIRGGTYLGVSRLTTSGTSGARITVQNYNGESVVLDGNDIQSGGTNFSSYVVDFNPASYVTLQSTGSRDTFHIQNSVGHAVRTANNSNTIIQGLSLHDVLYCGIYAYLSTNNLFHDNVVYNCHDGAGGGDSDGIQVSNNFTREAANCTISNNTIYNVADDAIDVFWLTGNIIRNNLIYQIGPTYIGGTAAGNGMKVGPGGSNTIYNNRIASCDNHGISGSEGPSNLMYNNTAYNCGQAWYAVWGDANGDGSGCILRNNIGAGTPSGNTFLVAITESHNTWNLSLTPTFVSTDPTNANFLKLAEGSPGVDVGTDLSAVFTTDAFGTTRPQGSAWDLGAHEVVPSGGGQPATTAGTKVMIWF
jgi:parallel beta-helix repeat protein